MVEKIKSKNGDKEALEARLRDLAEQDRLSLERDEDLKKRLAEAQAALAVATGSGTKKTRRVKATTPFDLSNADIRNTLPPVEPSTTSRTRRRRRKGNKKEVHTTNPAAATVTPPMDTNNEAPDTKKATVESPKNQVENFISEFNLGTLLPIEFQNLTEGQKLKVVTDLKRRIVDLVKSDAQTQYSEELKQRVQKDTNFAKKAVGAVADSVKKDSEIRALEKKAFEKIRDTDEGKKIIAEDLAILTKRVEERNIYIGTNGKPEILYVNTLDVPNVTSQESALIANFNQKATAFAEMPYEWGQEEKGVGVKIKGIKVVSNNKKNYEKAKKEYEKARAEILEIKTSRETTEEKGKAMLSVMEIDCVIKMEQLLNTHPEFEKALSDLSKNPGAKDLIKQAGSILNTFTGKNFTNRILIGGGFIARIGAKGAAVLTGISGLTLLGGITAGGVIGGIRGHIRGKETLQTRQKQARYGTEDISKEKVVVTDAEHLAKKLDNLVAEIQSLFDKGDSKNGERKLALLNTRIEHTQGKIEKGQVNFGSTKSALMNQFNLVSSLNNALVIRETNTLQVNKVEKERIDKWLAKVGGMIAEKTSSAQSSFIKKQMWIGAASGATLATGGYVLRWVGEGMGWWGNNANIAKGPGTDTSDGFIKRAETWLGKIWGQKNPEAPTGSNMGRLYNAVDKLRGHQPESADSLTPTTPATPPEAPATREPVAPATSEPRVPTTPSVETPPVAPPAQGLKVNPDSIVRKDEGVTHAFLRQLEKNPKLATDLGFTGDVNDKPALRLFTKDLATRTGYIGEGGEVRVAHADTVGYELTAEDGKPVVTEKSLDGKITDTIHKDGDKFETEREAYEYQYNKGETAVLKNAPVEAEVTTSVHPGVGEDVMKNVTFDQVPDAKNDALFKGVTFGENTDLSHEEVVRGKLEKDYGAGITEEPKAPSRAETATPDTVSQQKAILQNHPEFLKNPYNLPEEKLVETLRVSQRNADFLFGSHDSPSWRSVSRMRASKVMTAGNKLVTDYLNLIQNFSQGLKPQGSNWLIFRKAETVEQYIARGLQKITELGQLEVFESSLRK